MLENTGKHRGIGAVDHVLVDHDSVAFGVGQHMVPNTPVLTHCPCAETQVMLGVGGGGTCGRPDPKGRVALTRV